MLGVVGRCEDICAHCHSSIPAHSAPPHHEMPSATPRQSCEKSRCRNRLISHRASGRSARGSFPPFHLQYIPVHSPGIPSHRSPPLFRAFPHLTVTFFGTGSNPPRAFCLMLVPCRSPGCPSPFPMIARSSSPRRPATPAHAHRAATHFHFVVLACLARFGKVKNWRAECLECSDASHERGGGWLACDGWSKPAHSP